MDYDANEEYFRTLITQPPLSNYNQYNDEKIVHETVLERVFCEDDDVDYSTESEVSVLVSSQPNGQFLKNTVTPERPLVSNSIKIKTEKGNYPAVSFPTVLIFRFQQFILTASSL